MVEQYQAALRYLRTADHLLTQTYPFVQDPKLLLTVLENIFLAMSNSMAAVLQHEVQQKRIPMFGETFDDKLNAMKLHIAQRYQLRGDDLTLAAEIKTLLLARKKSPMEFVRKDMFVICGDNYHLQTLSAQQIK
ncbi:MAG TPA: hypothetical protein VJK52_02470, partial [Candidatus Nanoarchaeia archaeon]|nr:hypothetical protein [Candidatus Nanoarchaeia archaeon]